MADETHTPTPVLLLEGPDAGWDALAARVLAIGLQPARVDSIEEAKRLLTESATAITAALLPTDFADKRLKRALKELRKLAGPAGLRFAAVGEKPSKDDAKLLRAADVKLALWEPFDDATLRFQLNRAISGDEQHGRRDPRVPTFLVSRIEIGGRSKEAIIYSLSRSGAFLETPRASMDGARVELCIELPGHPIEVNGQVIFANVTGNLQRPNLPLGMGVRFDDLDETEAKLLDDYVESRLAQLEV